MVTLKEIQVHPVKRRLLHVDFLEVADDSRLVVDVPIRVEGKSKAEEVGGKLAVMLKQIRVACAPADIPAEIVVSADGIAINDILYVEAVTLPEGVEAVTRGRTPVIAGRTGRADLADEEGEEGEEGAEGEEAASEE